MKQPLILIAAEGGLCNRLRVLLSAVAFREFVSQPLRVAWAVNKECAVAFDDLFCPLFEEERQEADKAVRAAAPKKADFLIVPRSFAAAPATRSNLYLPRLWRSFSFDAQIKNYHPARHPSFLDLAQQYHRLYLSTCYALGNYPPTLLRHHLRPLPRLQKRIDALVSQFSNETIGVHIRRTDNAESIAHSPTEKFVAAMDTYPTATFYLATDDVSLKAHLQSRYGSRLLTQSTTARRDTLAGMEEALIDLFVLSRTSHLLGSYWSSFTDTAAELGGIPLRIVR